MLIPYLLGNVTNILFRGILYLFVLVFPPVAWGDVAKCKIEIEDVYKGSTYTLEDKFIFKDGGMLKESISKHQVTIIRALWPFLISVMVPCFLVNTNMTWATHSSSQIEAF